MSELRLAGRSLQSIAGELGIGYATVLDHMHSARMKLAEPCPQASPVSSRRLRVVPDGYEPSDVARLCRILDACGYDPDGEA